MLGHSEKLKSATISRRDFIKIATYATTSMIAWSCGVRSSEHESVETIHFNNLKETDQMSNNQTYRMYVGTYTTNMGFVDGKAEGIYLYQMEASSGDLSLIGVTKGIANPSYLVFHPNKRYMYAVNELNDYAGQPGGSVSAFSIDPQTGSLTLLNQQPTGGTSPCYVSIDHSGKYVLVANYGSGSFSVFPLGNDGKLGEATDHHQDAGTGLDPQRQEGPHAHSIRPDPANRFAIAADLGIDQLEVFSLDLEHGKILPRTPLGVAVKAGSGPRHLDFHPSGKFAYLINELNATVIVFGYDQAKGSLHELQTISTLPPDFQGHNQCADIHVHPSGRFVYGSNRGHDSIVVYQVDQNTGFLNYLGNEPTKGKTPRNFVLDPGGSFLFVANQDSSTIVTFRIDPDTGKLNATGKVTESPSPVCLKFY
jgi:6-phosphogluconolactonase